MKLEGRESLVIHIEGLQVTLAKRNARIAELEAMVAGGLESPAVKNRIEKEYKRGWAACAMRLEQTTREAALSLGAIRKNALDVYYEGERSSHTSEES